MTDTVEIAVQHLEEDFADVLFVDTIDTGLARLHRAVCRKDTGLAIGRENCNTERPKAADLDEETIELLMQATQWDRRLYEVAKRRFVALPTTISHLGAIGPRSRSSTTAP